MQIALLEHAAAEDVGASEGVGRLDFRKKSPRPGLGLLTYFVNCFN